MKRSSCRLRKVECPDCGYTIRMARSWMNVGLPSCPCGTRLEPSEAADRAFCGLLNQDDVPGPMWTQICRENGWEDCIVRKGNAHKQWLANPSSHLDSRRAGAGHCINPGCGRWIADGAEFCSAGHSQDPENSSVIAEAIPF